MPGGGGEIGLRIDQTLTQDAPPDQLTISRARQLSVPGWKRPVKQKKG